MKTTPVKGTKDFLPFEEELRNNIKKIIEETYLSFGYSKISTPILEDIQNLKNSEGGENLKLIFEVLKRGDKFDKAIENKEFINLADLGLRYDLTLPLSRFYADNKENLPKPFKVIQIDRVYRAERPQKGRMREFVQCDIDIIGSENYFAEVELILVTMKALEKLGLKNLVVKINNRKLLNEFLLSLGYQEKEVPSVCITFDKLDKMSAEDVLEELNSKNLTNSANLKLYDFIKNRNIDFSSFSNKKELDVIINLVKKLSNNKINIEFDMSLVRGQGYYTGTVFEVHTNEFGGAIAGGGRYDGLIGKFCGENTPAVGFSIGFERIFNILQEKNISFETKQKIAVFFDETNYAEKFILSEDLRKNYIVNMFETPKKLGKFLDKLESQNYVGFVYEGSNEIKFFEINNKTN